MFKVEFPKKFGEPIIFHITGKDLKQFKKREKELEEEQREDIIHPGMVLFLPNCTFRVSKPAVIGVRVLAGEIPPQGGNNRSRQPKGLCQRRRIG